MATLNIKGLPDGLYRKLQARARRERRSVAQEVTRMLAETLEGAPTESGGTSVVRERPEPFGAPLDEHGLTTLRALL